jgi:hypothetical protein
MEQNRYADDNRLLTVAVYDQIYLADLAKAQLLDQGVPCIIVDQNMIGMNLFYSNALGGIKIQVPAANYKQALGILKDGEHNDVPGVPIRELRCPACGSREVNPRRYNGLLLMLSALLLFVGTANSTLFSTSRSGYRCTFCRHDWDMIEED